MNPKFVLTLLLACCATAARAQGSSVRPMPAAGELIRVSPTGGEAYTGSLAALGRDTLLLTRPGDTAVLVSLSAQPLHVLRRPRESWSALGALSGGAAGLLLSRLARSSGRDVAARNASHAVLGSAVGAVAGGLTGFLVAPRRWQRLTVSPPRTLPPPEQAASAAESDPAPPSPPPAPPG